MTAAGITRKCREAGINMLRGLTVCTLILLAGCNRAVPPADDIEAVVQAAKALMVGEAPFLCPDQARHR